jgi:undecaprenyl-diphosphatase
MSLVNAILFDLMRASVRHPLSFAVARLLAEGSLPLSLGLFLLAWLRHGRKTQVELLQALAAGILGLAGLPLAAWLGQSLAADVLFLWGLSLGLLPGHRLAWIAFPGLALGLLAGWSRVYLGWSMPLDVVMAFPPAAVACLLVWRGRVLWEWWALHGVRRYHAQRRAGARWFHRFRRR